MRSSSSSSPRRVGTQGRLGVDLVLLEPDGKDDVRLAVAAQGFCRVDPGHDRLGAGGGADPGAGGRSAVFEGVDEDGVDGTVVDGLVMPDRRPGQRSWMRMLAAPSSAEDAAHGSGAPPAMNTPRAGSLSRTGVVDEPAHVGPPCQAHRTRRRRWPASTRSAPVRDRAQPRAPDHRRP